MQLKIITPEESLFEGEIDLIQVPGKKGTFEVLHNHAPIISTLTKGKVKVRPTSGEEKFFDIPGGVIQVKNNDIIVLTEMSI
ncbi:F-ATPase epsilon subunit [Salinivirga cyanobacteriivorans]|uniref:F-ATPase epsilon subunit n=1 Tax=Salinivirga cyanobacteriivorans TaxID=1307839 RepID=A0A0S2I051_9BACT|nr:ATP synthase F1 subunit epsilon [Salinivirga cyanobacteriivorans]ALO15645.1 F-ATPase epsilon subunit [Salinivirga cyanobacteriivorans]